MSYQVHAAWVSFLRGHAAVSRALNTQLVADHGLTMNDYEVLLRLSRAPDQQMKRVELAQSVVIKGELRQIGGSQGKARHRMRERERILAGKG